MTYTLPEIAEPLSPEQQVLELQRLLAAVLGCDKSLASKKDAGYRITEASKRGEFPSVEGGRVGFSCGVAHGLEFRQGQLKDGAPITRTDLEKAQRWFRQAINDALQKVSPEVRAQALADPAHVLASTQPLAAIDAITDPDAKAKALLNRVHAVLWKLDRGAAPYAPEAGHITPTLRQRLERHASAVPGMNGTTVLEALAALEERIRAHSLGNAPANDVARLFDPFRQILLHFDSSTAAASTAASAAAGSATGAPQGAPSRSVERIGLAVAGVIILFLAIDRFTGRDTKAATTTGDIITGQLDATARREAAKQDQSRATAHVEVTSFLADLATVRRLADDLELEMRLWREKVLALRTNDDGRRFATNDENVLNYRQSLRDVSDRDDAAMLSSLRQRLEELRQVAENGDKEGVAPTKEMIVLLGRERQRVQPAIEAYRKPREHIEQLLALATGTPGAKSLEQRLAELDSANAERNRQKLIDLDKQWEEERARKIVDARKSTFDAETASLEQQEREKALLQKARSLESKYPMFFREGLYSFQGYHSSNGGDDVYPDYAKRPSLADLTRRGITTDRKIFRAAILGQRLDYGMAFGQNDRGGFWQVPTSAEEDKKIEDAFKEFHDLAPYFVKAGLLRE